MQSHFPNPGSRARRASSTLPWPSSRNPLAVTAEWAYSSKPHAGHPSWPRLYVSWGPQRGQSFHPSSNDTGGTMHDQPKATEEEQEQVPERLEDEQEQQAQGHSRDAGPEDDED